MKLLLLGTSQLFGSPNVVYTQFHAKRFLELSLFVLRWRYSRSPLRCWQWKVMKLYRNRLFFIFGLQMPRIFFNAFQVNVQFCYKYEWSIRVLCFVKCVRLRTKIMEYSKNIWKVNFTCFFLKERCVFDPTLYSGKMIFTINTYTFIQLENYRIFKQNVTLKFCVWFAFSFDSV